MERIETKGRTETTDNKVKHLAFVNDLLSLKNDERLTFVDIVVQLPAEKVLQMLQKTRVADVLNGEDDQIALESDGSYYPVLDMRKSDSSLVGAGVRVWGWGSSSYKVDLSFFYQNPAKQTFSETCSANIGSSTEGISGHVYINEYAETGYEGHGFKICENISEEDITKFCDIVAEAVGDEPESISMYQDRLLKAIVEGAATDALKSAIERLINMTWPAQALYLLRRKSPETGLSIVAQSKYHDPENEAALIEAIEHYINIWRSKNDE